MSLDHAAARERGGLPLIPPTKAVHSHIADRHASASLSAITAATRADIDDNTKRFLNGNDIPLPIVLHPISSPGELRKREAEAREFLIAKCGNPMGFDASFDSWREVVLNHTRSLHVVLASAYRVCIDVLAQPDKERWIDGECASRSIRITKRTHVFLKMAKLTVGAEQKNASRYGRALRFAVINRVHPDSFIEFVEAQGGIDRCATAYTRLIARPENDGSSQPTAPHAPSDARVAERAIPVSETVALTKAARNGLDRLNFSNHRMVQCDVTMRRRDGGAFEIMSVRPSTGT